MRKIMAAIVFSLVILCVPILKEVRGFPEFPAEADACVYISGTSGYTGEKTVMAGGEILYMTLGDALSFEEDGVLGYSFSFEGEDIGAARNMLRMAVLKEERAGNITVLTGRSKYFDRCVAVEGRQVNVQIALSGGILTIGTPLILGSF